MTAESTTSGPEASGALPAPSREARAGPRRGGEPSFRARVSEWDTDGQVLGEYLLPLVILTAGVGMLAAQPTLLFAGALLAALTVGSRAWSRWAISGLVVDGHLSVPHLTRGDSLTLTLRIENPKPVAVPWCRLRLYLPPGLEAGSAGPVRTTFLGGHELVHQTDLGPRQRLSITHQLRTTRRGRHRLGPVRVAVSDLFGFYSSACELEAGALEVTVLPDPVPVPRLGGRQRREGDETRRRQPLGEDISRFRGLRPYTPGDPARTVDWKRSARLRELVVRQFEPSAARAELFLLDCDTAVSGPWDYSESALERSISVTAALLRQRFDAGASVGLVLNAVPGRGAGHGLVPIGRGATHLVRLYGALARVEASACRPMAQAMDGAGKLLRTRPSVICIATGTQPEVVARLTALHRRGHPVTWIHLGAKPAPVAPFEVLDWHGTVPEGARDAGAARQG